MNDENITEFMCLKIVMRIARKGVDMKSVFDSWDADGSGFLDTKEVVNGIRHKLNV